MGRYYPPEFPKRFISAEELESIKNNERSRVFKKRRIRKTFDKVVKEKQFEEF